MENKPEGHCLVELGSLCSFQSGAGLGKSHMADVHLQFHRIQTIPLSFWINSQHGPDVLANLVMNRSFSRAEVSRCPPRDFKYGAIVP